MHRMNQTSRTDNKGHSPNNSPRRNKRDAKPRVIVREPLDRSRICGAQPKHAIPSIGDRFEELTVKGYELGERGGVCYLRVQCSCGRPEHRVAPHTLRNGKSTRCNACAKKRSNYWRKQFFGYADILPDKTHRRRLLNRISACKNRCHNPNDANYKNYGGRGIHLYEPWRQGKEGKREHLAYLVTLDGWDEPSLELDRIDVDKRYEPGNLRFITKKRNNQNRRTISRLQAQLDAANEEVARLRSAEPSHRNRLTVFEALEPQPTMPVCPQAEFDPADAGESWNEE